MISNFIYDDIWLSTFDDGKYIVAYFSAVNSPTEPQRTINQTSLFMGKERPFMYSTYDSTISFNIGIMKNPCLFTDVEINITEMEKLKRWLSRPTAHVFRIVGDYNNWYDVDNGYQNIFWEGTFNLTEEIIGGKRIGVTLNFISTHPFALQDAIIYSGTVAANRQLTIKDISTEFGYIYPDVIITCLDDGDLEIYNDIEDRFTIVRNCSVNEKISFSKYLQIFTSDNDHDLYDDFNYKYLRIGNNYSTNENNIIFSLPCEYEISYNPVRRVIPV